MDDLDDQCLSALMALEDEQGFSSEGEPEYLKNINQQQDDDEISNTQDPPPLPKNDGLSFMFEDLEGPADVVGANKKSTQNVISGENLNPNTDLENELEKMRRKVMELEKKLAGNSQSKRDVQQQPKPQRKVLSPKTTAANNQLRTTTLPQTKSRRANLPFPKLPTPNNPARPPPKPVSDSLTNTPSSQSSRPNSQPQDTAKAVRNLPAIKSEQSGPGGSNQPKSPAVKRKFSDMVGEKEAEVWTEKFSGLSIINPLISSLTMNQRMEGRKVIRVGTLHNFTRAGELTVDGDWVTTGVLASKMAPRKSSNGRTFSIWKLNDLKDCERFVALFLFGDVFQQLWKTLEGSVLAILNPSVMPPKDNAQSDEVALNVDNAQKVMIIGTSKDFGKCQSKKKNGDPCTNIINKSACEYCSFHVQSAYKKIRSNRGEFHYGAPEPKSNFKKKTFNNGMYMYGGQTYSVSPRDSSAKKKPTVSKMSLSCVSVPGAKKVEADAKSLINTVSGQRSVTGCSDEFVQLLNLPTPGSINLVRHLETDKKKVAQTNDIFPGGRTASDLLKEHQSIVQTATRGQRRVAAPLHPPLTRPPGPKRPDSLEAARSVTPRLGRGLGDFDSSLITLETSPPSSSVKSREAAAHITNSVFTPPKSTRSERVKSKAVKLIHKAGPLQKTDPNAVKKHTSPETQSKINSRVEKSVQEISSGEGGSEGSGEQVKKKLASEDPEFLKLMNVTSSHAGAVSEAETEHRERYFKELERKEQMQEKMVSITEIQAKVVVCHQCKYLALGPAPSCKEANHSLTWRVAKKRFFACRQCNTRTITLDRYPTRPCSKCGSNKFSKTGMCKEKEGPKLESEILVIRGEETKFLNSLW